MLHSKARKWRVLGQHAIYHSALPLTALPLSLPFSTSCLPLLLRWPNNSFTLIAWKLPAFGPRAAVYQAMGRKSPFPGQRP